MNPNYFPCMSSAIFLMLRNIRTNFYVIGIHRVFSDMRQGVLASIAEINEEVRTFLIAYFTVYHGSNLSLNSIDVSIA